MNIALRAFCVSFLLICLAWMAKLQFVFGGDYLFRLGTVSALIAMLVMYFFVMKQPALSNSPLRRLFLINLTALFILYAGMMMKVSHIMETQWQKDLVLDVLGIPLIALALMYNFSAAGSLMSSSKALQTLYIRFVLLPWVLFFFSFMLYAVYSAALAAQK